ncbi:MAG: type II toxin-antitoxin system Phd/YefM family antitoxin [Alphaproteobacteria bacterium]
MKSVRIADLKDHLSTHLRAVERGSSIEVRDRDRPIARIVPVSPGPPRLQVVRANRPFATVRDRRHSPARWAVSSLDLLLEERGKR